MRNASPRRSSLLPMIVVLAVLIAIGSAVALHLAPIKPATGSAQAMSLASAPAASAPAVEQPAPATQR